MSKIIHRVFYIDTSGISPIDVPTYMEEVRKIADTKETMAIFKAKKSGNWLDFWIPTKEKTKIEILCANLDKPFFRSKILRRKRKKI